MKALLILALVGSLGCEYFKEKTVPMPSATNIRCESISPPAPDIPEDRRKRLDEIADLNSYIDLEIAKADKAAIDSGHEWIEVLRKGYQEDRDKKASGNEQGRDLKYIAQARESLDKALEVAARHRHP